MNPALAVLIIIGLIAIWFLLSGIYKAIGSFVYRIGKDAIDAMLEEAEGKADAKRIAAEAEAEANKMIAESLTDELIEMSMVEQWSGNYPYIVGSDTANIVDIGTLLPTK